MLLCALTRCQTIEALDCALESVFQTLFGADGVREMRSTEPFVSNESGTLRYMPVSSMEDKIRDVVIDESQFSPKRRYLDAILEVYGNQYELLLKNQVDKLTGLSNRQLLDEKVSRLTAGGATDRRKNEPHRIVVIFDIDHFKLINDRFGHLYGDEVLVLIAHMMKLAFRTDDWLFRYGGEEFLVFLNNVDIDQGRSAINRFLHQVESHDFPQIGKVTISCGYTCYKSNESFSTIFDCADKALYFSKGNGRNQSRFYEDLVANGDIESTERDSDIDLF
ncbi:hypothetical protein A9Q81_22745 [Gammaproteobacteria bacterium 42_54_T18]|nr:hypothetical protein A9Q81_22745 [Gammaproteobacteria bacterium 42_54_T18]